MNVCDSDEFEREAERYQFGDGFQSTEKAVVAKKKSRQEWPPNRYAPLRDQDTGDNDESQTKGQVASSSPSTGSLRAILSLTQQIKFENCARKSSPIEATAIFTTGANKIVYRDNELINVRDACSEFSQKSNGCQWYIKTFQVPDGTANLREQDLVREIWAQRPKEGPDEDPFRFIQPHTLYTSGSGFRGIIPPLFKERKVEFSTPAGNHVNVHSHLQRSEVLHHYRMKNEDNYKRKWGSCKGVEEFLQTCYPDSYECPDLQEEKAVSFFYPTIQVGFDTRVKRGRRPYTDKIYYQNPGSDDDHHRFLYDPDGVWSTEFKLDDYRKYIKTVWKKEQKPGHQAIDVWENVRRQHNTRSSRNAPR